jgi:hypothetical protein
MSKREFYDRVKKATVAVIMELPNSLPQRSFTIVGSGFCIHPAGIIATSETVFRTFFDKRAYQELVKGLPENLRPIEHCQISQQPQVMICADVQDGQLFAPVIAVTEVVTGLGFGITLFKLCKHGAFPGGYHTIEIADFNELHEMQEIAICGFPLRGGLFDHPETVSSSFTAGTISSIVPRAGVSASDVKGYELELTATIGNVGGPVFSLESGKVFGVLQGSVRRPRIRASDGIAKAEPIHPAIEHGVIQRFIDGTHRPPGL